MTCKENIEFLCMFPEYDDNMSAFLTYELPPRAAASLRRPGNYGRVASGGAVAPGIGRVERSGGKHPKRNDSY